MQLPGVGDVEGARAPRRAWWPLAALVASVALGTLGALGAAPLAGGAVEAQQPWRAQQPQHAQQPQQAQLPLGAFAGAPPAAGSLGLLVTTEDATAAALVATLGQAGCDTTSVTTLAGAAPQIHVPGAPPLVNAAFPATLPAETPVIVRCGAAAVPAVDAPNAGYTIDGGVVALADGRSEVPVAAGSATSTVTTLSARRSYGDLDGDGLADAAVALVHDPGGSGTFHYLAVLAGGSTGPAPTLPLGDRVIVDRVAIAHGRVTVSYLTRTFDEALAALPTVPVTRHFALAGGALVELGGGSCEAPGLEEVGAFVFVTTPASGAEVSNGFAVSGCSRTFESTVNWRLLDRAGAEIASGFAMGGGVDGPGRYAFSVEYDVDARQLGHLEVFETDASGGEGFPPPSNTIVLVLR